MWIRIFLVSLLLMIVACSEQTATPDVSLSGQTLKVLAGSEARDLQPVFATMAEQIGIRFDIDYIGTLDGAEKLLTSHDYDLALFSHNKYIALLPGARERMIAQEKLMLSPVVLGVKRSLAQQWGWIDNTALTWQDIAAKAAEGQLRYAMTNPTSSNSGFSALMGVAAALQSADTLGLKDFFKGQVLTAGSSGWLAETYTQEEHKLDGLINYESVLISLNQSGRLQEPLVLIYPQEGIVTANYPLTLLNKDKLPAFQAVVEYLKSPPVQTVIMQSTFRRPVNSAVMLDAVFHKGLLIELPFPAHRQAVDQLLNAYLDQHSRPSHTLYVLDTSGSMSVEPLSQLKQALINLTGVDQSLSGRFARFRAREQVTFIPFNQSVGQAETFEVTETDPHSQTMQSIRDYINGLYATGGTATYDALTQAYATLSQFQAQTPDRFYSIMLLTDGNSNIGLQVNDFLQQWQQLPTQTQEIRVFPVLFGESNDREMALLAEYTRGKVFDGRTTQLSQLFKKIRSYQ